MSQVSEPLRKPTFAMLTKVVLGFFSFRFAKATESQSMIEYNITAKVGQSTWNSFARALQIFLKMSWMPKKQVKKLIVISFLLFNKFIENNLYCLIFLSYFVFRKN